MLAVLEAPAVAVRGHAVLFAVDAGGVGRAATGTGAVQQRCGTRQEAQQEQVGRLEERERRLVADLQQERSLKEQQTERLTRLCAALHAAGIATAEQKSPAELQTI